MLGVHVLWNIWQVDRKDSPEAPAAACWLGSSASPYPVPKMSWYAASSWRRGAWLNSSSSIFLFGTHSARRKLFTKSWLMTCLSYPLSLACAKAVSKFFRQLVKYSRVFSWTMLPLSLLSATTNWLLNIFTENNVWDPCSQPDEPSMCPALFYFV